MPLRTFRGAKFSPKKSTPRKSHSVSSLLKDLDPVQAQEEFGLDVSTVRVNLGGNLISFDSGNWTVEVGDGKVQKGHSTGTEGKEQRKLRKENQQLREENNLLRIKVELLLDMLTQTTAEAHLQEKEIEQLQISRKK